MVRFLIWSALTIALILATLLSAAVVFAPSCSQYPAAESAATKATETLTKAREHIDSVRSYLDTAQQVAVASTNVTTELAAADLALQRERYRECIGHLRTAIGQVEGLGVRVPPEVQRRLVEAELLLGIVGQ